MITIMLVEDHNVVRQGLRALLEAEPDFSIIGEAADGLEALDLAEQLKPDVLIVDIMLPGLNGLEITRRMHQNGSGPRVVVLSMLSDEAHVYQAMINGAAAYVLKSGDSDDLVKAVREAVAGRRYLSPPFSEQILDVYAQKRRNASHDLYETLTAREREILQLAAEGYTSAEIAERLIISPRTAETHRANMMRKLGLHNQVELVSYCVRRGIVNFT
jgi:two-component system response regulator NreC